MYDDQLDFLVFIAPFIMLFLALLALMIGYFISGEDSECPEVTCSTCACVEVVENTDKNG